MSDNLLPAPRTDLYYRRRVRNALRLIGMGYDDRQIVWALQEMEEKQGFRAGVNNCKKAVKMAHDMYRDLFTLPKEKMRESSFCVYQGVVQNPKTSPETRVRAQRQIDHLMDLPLRKDSMPNEPVEVVIPDWRTPMREALEKGELDADVIDVTPTNGNGAQRKRVEVE